MRHRHLCACGDYFLCSQAPDKCPKDWTCPACEQQQRDEYFQQVAELRAAIKRAEEHELTHTP